METQPNMTWREMFQDSPLDAGKSEMDLTLPWYLSLMFQLFLKDAPRLHEAGQG